MLQSIPQVSQHNSCKYVIDFIPKVDYKNSTAIWDYPTQQKTKESLLIENMDYDTSSGRNPIQNGS